MQYLEIDGVSEIIVSPIHFDPDADGMGTGRGYYRTIDIIFGDTADPKHDTRLRITLYAPRETWLLQQYEAEQLALEASEEEKV